MEEHQPLVEERENSLSHQHNGVIDSIILISHILGSGLLLQGFVFLESGIAVAPEMYLVVAVANYFGCATLFYIMENRGMFDYASLAGDVLGAAGWWSVQVASVIQGFGSIMSFFILMGSMLQTVIIAFAGGDSDWYTDLFFLSALCIVVMAPLSVFQDHPSSMHWISVAGMTTLSVSFGFILIDSPLNASIYSSENLKTASFSGFLESVGFIYFALSINTVFPSICTNNGSGKDSTSFDAVIAGSQFVGAVLLFAVGLTGYLCFRNETQVNIMDNFAGNTASAFKCIAVGFLLLNIPRYVISVRNAILALVRIDVESIDKSHMSLIGINGLVLTVIGFSAVLLQEYYGPSTALSHTVNITGGVGGAFLSIGLPGLIGYKCGSASFRPYIFLLLIFVSFFSTVAVIAGAILS